MFRYWNIQLPPSWILFQEIFDVQGDSFEESDLKISGTLSSVVVLIAFTGWNHRQSKAGLTHSRLSSLLLLSDFRRSMVGLVQLKGK